MVVDATRLLNIFKIFITDNALRVELSQTSKDVEKNNRNPKKKFLSNVKLSRFR